MLTHTHTHTKYALTHTHTHTHNMLSLTYTHTHTQNMLSLSLTHTHNILAHTILSPYGMYLSLYNGMYWEIPIVFSWGSLQQQQQKVYKQNYSQSAV